MSKANDLLESLAAGDISVYAAGQAPEEEHIVIGDDRVISVPDSLKRIAVQWDHDIETVTFDCPRYWDGHDLSKMAIYINHLCPSGALGSTVATNVTVDESDSNTMHFDWTISDCVTVAEGYITFLVCAKTQDEDGTNRHHWNSEINKEMYVSAGLELPDDFVETHPDILTQVLLFNQNVLELQKTTMQRSAVYVGSGDMPDGYNVQIDPDGNEPDPEDSPTDSRSDWNQNDPDAANFIKNRQGGYYKKEVKTITVEADTWTESAGFPPFADGDTVTVNVNGIDYSAVAAKLEYNTDCIQASITPSDTSNAGFEKLTIKCYENEVSCLVTPSEAVVKYTGTFYTPWTREYLPDNVAYLTDDGVLDDERLPIMYAVFGDVIHYNTIDIVDSTKNDPYPNIYPMNISHDKFDALFKMYKNKGGGVVFNENCMATVTTFEQETGLLDPDAIILTWSATTTVDTYTVNDEETGYKYVPTGAALYHYEARIEKNTTDTTKCNARIAKILIRKTTLDDGSLLQ